MIINSAGLYLNGTMIVVVLQVKLGGIDDLPSSVMNISNEIREK